jgi:hypothetical protein
MLGVLLMALEDLQACLQQALQLGIAGRGDQLRFQHAVDRLVVGNLVGDIGLVEGCAGELAELGELVGGRLRQRLAGVVVLRRDVDSASNLGPFAEGHGVGPESAVGARSRGSHLHSRVAVTLGRDPDRSRLAEHVRTPPG